MKEDIRQFQAARYALLSEVVLLIAKTTDIEQLQRQLINSLKWVLDFERCTMALLNSDRSSYQLRTLLETRPGIPGVDEPALSLSTGIPGEVIRTQQMRLVSAAGEQVLFSSIRFIGIRVSLSAAIPVWKTARWRRSYPCPCRRMEKCLVH